MKWHKSIRRTWRNYVRRHRRLLRRQLNRCEYYSLTSLLQNEYMTMSLWGTPAVAERVDNGWLHMVIREAGDRMLAEAKTTEGIAARVTEMGVLGVYMLFPDAHLVEVVVGFSEDACFRELVQQYFRDCLEEHGRYGDDCELTVDDQDGTLTAFGLGEVMASSRGGRNRGPVLMFEGER